MLLRLVTCSLLLALAQLTSAGLAMPNHHGRDPAKGLDLLILHTNDMHSRYEQINRYSVSCSAEESAGKQCFGGFARVATQIKQARMDAKGSGPSVLALNAGDTFQGSIFHNVFRWRIAAELTNMLAFDAMALGNHEFDDGLEGLVPFLKAVNKSHFVAANLDASDFPELQTLFQPSVVLNVDGTRVGVIGYITNETSWLSHPSEKVRFLDEVETVTAEAERLHQEGVRIIIALGHSGFPVDKIIAQRVPHLDLVVGGHSHTFLYSGNKPDVEEPIGPYPTFVRQASGRIVPVVQAYAYTKYLGRTRVLFDVDGEIESVADVQGQPMLLDYTMEQDPEVEKVVETWRRKLEPTVTKPVGRTLVFLNGSCRARECNLGNLVSDALVYHRALRYEGPGWTDAPIGIQNGGNIRASIHVRDNGTITKRDTLEVCPFENLLLVIYVRGDILLEVLENSVKHYDTSGEHDKGSFLQFSGLKVVYNITSSGRRVVSASARCGNCTTPSYSEVHPDATYGVITNSFLYEGGDGYSMLTGLPNLRLPDITAYSALDEYLRSHIAVFPGEEGRIVFVNNEQDLHDQPAASVGSGASPSRVALLPVHVALLVLNLLYCALTSR